MDKAVVDHGCRQRLAEAEFFEFVERRRHEALVEEIVLDLLHRRIERGALEDVIELLVAVERAVARLHLREVRTQRRSEIGLWIVAVAFDEIVKRAFGQRRLMLAIAEAPGILGVASNSAIVSRTA